MKRRSPFEGRLALVTGGASGIGSAVGATLAERGARVVLADIDQERAREAAAVIDRRSGPERAFAMPLDVADGAAFEATVESVERDHGPIDLLVNNAGVALLGETWAVPEAAWRRVLGTNLDGVLYGVAAVYPRMVRRGRGHICNVACVAGLTPVPLAAVYSASKHAVVGFSTSLRAEAADLGIEVSVVCPGAVATDLFRRSEKVGLDGSAVVDALPSGRLLDAERCARRIVAGIGANRAIITVPAYARLIWWFHRLAPGAAFMAGARFARAMRRRFGA